MEDFSWRPCFWSARPSRSPRQPPPLVASKERARPARPPLIVPWYKMRKPFFWSCGFFSSCVWWFGRKFFFVLGSDSNRYRGRWYVIISWRWRFCKRENAFIVACEVRTFALNQLMVNRWFGSRWAPNYRAPNHRAPNLRDPNHRAPNHRAPSHHFAMWFFVDILKFPWFVDLRHIWMRFASRRRAQLHWALGSSLWWWGDSLRGTSKLAGKLEIFGNEMAKMIQIVQRCRIFGTSKSVACEAVRTGESASSRAGVWMPKLGWTCFRDSWQPAFFFLANQTHIGEKSVRHTHRRTLMTRVKHSSRLQNPKASTPSSPPESPSEGGNSNHTVSGRALVLKIVVQYGSLFVLFSIFMWDCRDKNLSWIFPHIFVIKDFEDMIRHHYKTFIAHLGK